jgi:hypothetical protein
MLYEESRVVQKSAPLENGLLGDLTDFLALYGINPPAFWRGGINTLHRNPFGPVSFRP